VTDSVDRPIAAVPGLGPGALVIERVETVALRAPLGRRFQGSAYSMNNRCTIVTRLFTADGLVSEVYTGDTDAEQATNARLDLDAEPPRRDGPERTVANAETVHGAHRFDGQRREHFHSRPRPSLIIDVPVVDGAEHSALLAAGRAAGQ